MIIYNVTVKVDAAIAGSWLRWLRHEHAPEMLTTACFTGYKVVRLLEIDDSDGPTYAVQYYADTLDKYNEYITRFAFDLRKKALDKWGDKFTAFRTVMEVMDER